MKNLIGLIMSVILSSCSGIAFHLKSAKKSKYAPEGHKEVGVVEYNMDGDESIVSESRDKAYIIMHEDCNGSYEIINQGEVKRNQSTYYNNLTNSLDTSTKKRWRFEYYCK